MKEAKKNMQNRRSLLLGSLRYATLGVVGVAGGGVIAKRRRLVREGKCVGRGICSACGVFDGCGLPQALSAKQILSKRK